MTGLLVAAASTPVAVALGLRTSVRRSKQGELRRRTIEALGVLRDVIEADGAIPYAADGIVEVLHLRSCHFEAAQPGADAVAVMDRDGAFEQRVQHRDRSGLLLPDAAHLPVGQGRFTMVPHPERSSTIEERLVAVSIAAVATMAIDAARRSRHPGEAPAPAAAPVQDP